MASLLDQALAHPEVLRSAGGNSDLSRVSEPIAVTGAERDGLRLGFLQWCWTAFSWPQQITLDELRLESYFLPDEATQRAREQLAAR